MLIQSILPSIKPNIYAKNPMAKVSFRAAEKKDTFEKSALKINDKGRDVDVELVNRMKLQDRSGSSTFGSVVRGIINPNSYYAIKGDEVLCSMTMYDNFDSIFIDKLYGQYGMGEYKGAGGALFKEAVKQSVRSGYNGRVNLVMAGSFPFYYKNNVRISDTQEDYLKKNAVLDYNARQGYNLGALWRSDWSYPLAKLDEKGAQALLQGERLYQISESKVLGSEKIYLDGEYIDADIDFCDFGEKFVIQIIDKNAPHNAQIATLEGTRQKYDDIDTYECENIWVSDKYGQNSALENMLKEALEAIQAEDAA